MKSHLLSLVPYTAIAALAFAVSPLHADSPLARSGGSGSGTHVHFSTGGVSHPSISGGGSGGVHVVVHHRGGGGSGTLPSQIVSHIPVPIVPPFRRGPWVRVRYGFIYPAGSVSSTGSSASPSDAASYVYPYADDNTATSGSGDISAFDLSTVDPNAVDASTGYPTAPGTVPNMSPSIQIALANAGYYRGAINGVIGPASHGAIAAYQRAHGLPVTGLVDVYLLHALGLYQ